MAPREVPEGVRERVRKRSRNGSSKWMDFERLGPQEQSSRVHGVRFVENRCIAEWVTKMDQNGDQNELQNRSKLSHLALLGPTFDILEGSGKGSFLTDFRSAKSADKNRWMLALGRPGGRKSPTAGLRGGRFWAPGSPRRGSSARGIDKSINSNQLINNRRVGAQDLTRPGPMARRIYIRHFCIK